MPCITHLGFSQSEATLKRRLDHHRRGTGARLMQVVTASGIDWIVARTWPEGDRARERMMMDGGQLKRYCPISRGSRVRGKAARRGDRPEMR
jgi:hypothetical protein